MPQLIVATEPFVFYTRLHLSELTGLRACTVTELLDMIKEVSQSCIYHHTHRYLQPHQFLSPEPPNDFAYWVTNVWGERRLGERLASIDIVQFSSLRQLRDAIVLAIENYLEKYPHIKRKFASPGDEFHFTKTVSFFLPTPYIAHNLSEFADLLKQTTLNSLYFHIFEARLRLDKGINDFSYWLDTSLGESKLSDQIQCLDPYTYTMNDLKITILKLINNRLSELEQNNG